MVRCASRSRIPTGAYKSPSLYRPMAVTREPTSSGVPPVSTILIVDDSPLDRRLAAGLLGHAPDWRIELAEDGAAALEAILKSPPDVIVTDLQMPEMNGLELVSNVRRQFPHIPVILMTAQGSEEIAIAALHAGAASYVPKRILASELQPTVRRVLTQAGEDRSQATLMNRLQERTEAYILETDLNLMMTMSRHLQLQLGDAWCLDKSDRMRIGTAVEEALLNAYYHGNLEVSSKLKEEDFSSFYALAEVRARQSPYKERRVTVRLTVTPLQASITITDEGQGFDPQSLPDPTDIENLDKPCGRGVMLMRSFMDHIEYNPKGNAVTLIKRRFAKDQAGPA